MKTTPRILIIEDEIKTSITLKQGLEEKGFQVDSAFDGIKGLELATRNPYDLIVSDLMIPHLSGLTLCEKIRKMGIDTPVIMLTALGMTSDKIKGFDSGADDYMVKPFEFAELLVRIRALLKRSVQHSRSDVILEVDNLRVNLDTKEVVRGNKTINLTAKEFALLEYLMKNKGRVLSKSDIAEQVWNLNFDTGTNIVEVYVNYLRNKIDKEFENKLIQTRIGMGYLMKNA